MMTDGAKKRLRCAVTRISTYSKNPEISGWIATLIEYDLATMSVIASHVGNRYVGNGKFDCRCIWCCDHIEIESWT